MRLKKCLPYQRNEYLRKKNTDDVNNDKDADDVKIMIMVIMIMVVKMLLLMMIRARILVMIFFIPFLKLASLVLPL